MEIRPILSSLLRNKTGALLIAAQVALSLAIVANALYIIQDRIERTARTSGVGDESTQIRIAAVPIVANAVSSFGTRWTSRSPNARVARERRCAMCRPISSSFTISATAP